MIEDYLTQLTFAPIVRNALSHTAPAFVMGGMGGSGTAAAAVAFLLPKTHILVHREYGLPQFTPADALYIAVSYSGTTEETVQFANAALRHHKRLAIVASGGTLADMAERHGLPCALVPEGLAPRNALIYMVRAILSLMRAEKALSELAHVENSVSRLAEEADEDADFMLPSVPLFYSSSRNEVLTRLSKAYMNETARMPAFANVFPEVNHNEMQAFDVDMPEGLQHTFRFVLFEDSDDGDRITTRMQAFKRVLAARGRSIRSVDISGMSRSEALVHVWVRSATAARLLAETRGIDPDTQPLVDEFKTLL